MLEPHDGEPSGLNRRSHEMREEESTGHEDTADRNCPPREVPSGAGRGGMREAIRLRVDRDERLSAWPAEPELTPDQRQAQLRQPVLIRAPRNADAMCGAA